jgi:hypothetical protein
MPLVMDIAHLKTMSHEYGCANYSIIKFQFVLRHIMSLKCCARNFFLGSAFFDINLRKIKTFFFGYVLPGYEECKF